MAQELCGLFRNSVQQLNCRRFVEFFHTDHVLHAGPLLRARSTTWCSPGTTTHVAGYSLPWKYRRTILVLTTSRLCVERD